MIRPRKDNFLIESHGESWHWEHCGMMADDNYRKRWERKKKLYERNAYTDYPPKNQ